MCIQMITLTEPFSVGHIPMLRVNSLKKKKNPRECIYEVQIHDFVHPTYQSAILRLRENPLLRILSIVQVVEKCSLDHLGLKRRPAPDSHQEGNTLTLQI